MRIFNEEKTIELKESELNYSVGKLVEDTLFIRHIPYQPEVQEEFHYEVIAEYPNGGKDVEKVVDIPYQPEVLEHDEYEDIYVFVPLEQKELDSNRIIELKGNLTETDYKAIKFAEGEITAEEYEPMRLQRKAWRDEINELEKKLEKK